MRPSTTAFLLSALGLTLASPVRAAAPTFQYTDLSDCPSDTARYAEGIAHNADVPTVCPGPGGRYEVTESYGPYDIHRSVNSTDEGSQFRVDLRPSTEDCPVARYGHKLEWRLSEGKPFAVIQRITCYTLNEKEYRPGERLAEYLVVKGLKGFESIDGTVNTRTKNANEKARAIADAGLRSR